MDQCAVRLDCESRQLPGPVLPAHLLPVHPRPVRHRQRCQQSSIHGVLRGWLHAQWVLIGKTRLLQPYEFISGVLATIGAALLYTLDADSSKARYIGPQVIFGIGIGLGNQVPMTALQSFSKPEHIAPTTGVMLMCNSISGAYFVTAAQSIFANYMLKRLAATAPNIDPIQVLTTGASEVSRVFQGADREAVRSAYMAGIKDVFAFALAGAALTVLISLAIPFKKLPKPPAAPAQTEKDDKAEKGEKNEQDNTKVATA